MKRIAILLCFAVLASIANAQLTTGPSGLTLKAGTSFYSQGLVLTPSTDLTLENDTILVSGTALPIGTGNSIERVYTISPSLTFSGTLGIQYIGSELNGNQENTLSVINASPNASFIALSSVASNNNSYYVYSSGLGDIVLNQVTATSAGIPLPVLYNNFQALAGPSCSIQLSWSATQAQPGNFHMERSQDGKAFQVLTGIVSQSGEQFSFTDPNPLPGKSIYRLAIREMDKPVLYSTVLALNNPCALSSPMRIYPNPTTGSLTVALGTVPDGLVTIDLLDITGKLLKTFRTLDQVSTLDLQGMVPGSYLLKVQNGSSYENIKIVKH